MTERVIDLAEEPARLSVRNRCLRIQREGQDDACVPLAEVGVVVVANPRVTFTSAVAAGLAGAGASLVVCDGRRMPAAMLLPLEAHYVQGERFAQQAEASVPLHKRLWQSLVRAKIRAQARVLTDLRGHDGGLCALIPRVRSGDPGNVEAEASRRYWRLVFDERAFRRNRLAEDQNRLLNYGDTFGCWG